VLGVRGHDIDLALSLVDRALTLNPSFARGWHWSGVLRNLAGDPDLALEHLDTALRLSPRERRSSSLSAVGWALFMKRRFEEAAAKLVEALERAPNFTIALRFLAAAYAHLGRLAEAREIVERLRAINPVVVPTGFALRDPQQKELLLSGLRLAAGETG
jgi:adenylate cyclase